MNTFNSTSTQTDGEVLENIETFTVENDISDYIGKDVSIGEEKVKLSEQFNFLYKGERHYYPGYPLKTNIDDLDMTGNLKHLVYRCLLKRMNRIQRDVKRMHGNKKVLVVVNGNRKRFTFPCPVLSCTFSGNGQPLKRHLTSKEHRWRDKDARLQVSIYQKHYCYTSRIVKSGNPFPTQCNICNVIVERFDKHFRNCHPSYLIKNKEKFPSLKKKMSEQTRSFFQFGFHKNKEFYAQKLNDSPLIKNVGFSIRKEDKIINSRKDICQITSKSSLRESLTRKLLSSDLRDNLRLKDERFHYYYENSKELLSDFLLYLVEIKQNTNKTAKQRTSDVEEMWTSIDDKMSMCNNQICQNGRLEENFVLPLKNELLENQLLPKEERTKYIQASTIRVKLGSLRLFIEFLLRRGIFAGMSWDQMELMQRIIDEQCDSLRKMISEREQDLKDFDGEHLLTVVDVKKYMMSDHVKRLENYLELMEKAAIDKDISKNMVTNIRDHLMFKLTWTNALRASNIMNCTLEDFDSAADSKTMYSKRYKTSAIYGKKAIFMSCVMYKQLHIYINKMRMNIITDGEKQQSERYIFTSSIADSGKIAKKINHCTISGCLTATFKKAGIFIDDEINRRISPTRIRKSVATTLVSNGNASAESIASSFMMHNEACTKRYYIQQCNMVEASKIFQTCDTMLTLGLESKEPGQKIKMMDNQKNRKEILQLDTFGHVDQQEIFPSAQSTSEEIVSGISVDHINCLGKRTETNEIEDIQNDEQRHYAIFGFQKILSIPYTKELSIIKKILSILRSTLKAESAQQSENNISKENVIDFQSTSFERYFDGRFLEKESDNLCKLSGKEVAETGKIADCESFATKDWYISRKYKRSIILEVIFAIDPFINQNKEPTRDQWRRALLTMKTENIILKEVGNLDWQSVRNILKAMWKKFRQEICHQKYVELLDEARQYVKNEYLPHSCL